MTKYLVFSRSCRNWDEYVTARRKTVRHGLTIEEARQMCADFNDNRSSVQVKRGMKYEFTAE